MVDKEGAFGGFYACEYGIKTAWVPRSNTKVMRTLSAKGKIMQYTKPVIVAQNKEKGCFAAGCGANDHCNGGGSTNSSSSGCKACERTQ
jgi:hypothetical protein